MLATLFGSKSMQKILIFLFVNNKCYGTQLQKILGVPLTPLQNALARLEKGGIVTSYYEGKTRVYQFNPAFPLLFELEALLKKTYTLLSPQDKKQFNLVKLQRNKKNVGDTQQILYTFWERLASVNRLLFNAKTQEGWVGKGKGEVLVSKEGDSILIFNEKGTWKGENGGEIDFSNIFRWTFDKSAGMISLEHLRRGPNLPVFLFHLVPAGSFSLSSIDSHLCDGDTYFGQISCDHHSLRLSWRVIGQKKNEELDYYYS